MARVARAGRFFGFGLAIYLLSYLYIYDIGVWTPPPASQGAAASLARFSGVSPYLRSSDCFRLVFAHSADHKRKSADLKLGAKGKSPSTSSRRDTHLHARYDATPQPERFRRTRA